MLVLSRKRNEKIILKLCIGFDKMNASREGVVSTYPARLATTQPLDWRGHAMATRHPIEIGSRFGHLTVTGPIMIPVTGHGMTKHWICQCECGKVQVARPYDLRWGRVRSCGCRQRMSHGRSRSPEYRIWLAIRQRCNNPQTAEYARYGGSGIRVCDTWEASFEAFFADMGLRPSNRHQIDRIDNLKGYEPGNCRWVTPRESTNNRRNTVFLTYLGETRPLSEWADVFGLTHGVLFWRIRRGWSIHRALTFPRIPKPRRNSC